MIFFAFCVAVSGVLLLMLCLFVDYSNRKIDTVFYSPEDAENDECQIRELLILYPRAVIVVPESDVNCTVFKNNSRVIIQ